jgi:CDP-4-dehydro-6-deoxyglucose reductase
MMKFFVKNDCEIIEKRELIEGVYFIKYSFQEGFEWTPGQYVGITINPTYRRSYSILDYDGRNLSFIIDIKPGGIASQYFEKCKVGDKNQILGPYGRFIIQNTSLEKVFICTGTGVVPIIPIINNYISTNPNNKVKLFFGARHQEDDFALKYFEKLMTSNVEYTQCITRDSELQTIPHVHSLQGRVTQVVSGMDLNWGNTEFYVCGNPQMVLDMETILKEKNAAKILIEKY